MDPVFLTFILTAIIAVIASSPFWAPPLLKAVLKRIGEARARAQAKRTKLWNDFYLACVEAECEWILAHCCHLSIDAELRDLNQPSIVVRNPDSSGFLKVMDYQTVVLTRAQDVAEGIVTQIGWQVVNDGREDYFLASYSATTSKNVLEAALEILKSSGWVANVEQPQILSVRPIKNVEAEK